MIPVHETTRLLHDQSVLLGPLFPMVDTHYCKSRFGLHTFGTTLMMLVVEAADCPASWRTSIGNHRKAETVFAGASCLNRQLDEASEVSSAQRSLGLRR